MNTHVRPDNIPEDSNFNFDEEFKFDGRNFFSSLEESTQHDIHNALN